MPREEIAGFSVAFGSEHEVVLVKPAGIASELTSDPKCVSLLSRVRAAGFVEAKLPHRLDRISRGFLLVALSAEAIRFHNEQVKKRAWSKIYLARVVSPPAVESQPLGPVPRVCEDRAGVGAGAGAGAGAGLVGQHKAYLRRGRDRMEVVRSGGQPSFLQVHCVAPSPERAGESHVVIELLTGRYHQIRVMLADLGVPLVGDHLYGSSGAPFYLEHVAFGFRPCGREAEIRIYDPHDSERERVAPEIAESISALHSRR